MYNCIAIHDQSYLLVLQKKILQYIVIPMYCCIPSSNFLGENPIEVDI